MTTSFHSEAWNISNKYRPPSNIPKHYYFYTKYFIFLFRVEKQLALYIANVFWNIQFLPHFPLLLTVSQVRNISNKYCLLIISAKETFLHKDTLHCYFVSKKIVLSIAESFRNIHFLPHFYLLSQWMRCAIFQINIVLLVIYQNINVSTQFSSYPSFLPKKIGALHSKRFSKYPVFITLLLTVSQVCNISNKYCLLIKSAKDTLHRSLILKRNWALHRRLF